MEVSKPNDQQSGISKRGEKFEIDEHEFREIQVDNNRVIAKGKGL